MNKGIPYLMAALVALALSAGWAAPVLALFDQVAACLDSGGSLDLLHLRCAAPSATGNLLLGNWVFWLTGAGVAIVAVVITQVRPSRRRLPAPTPGG